MEQHPELHEPLLVHVVPSSSNVVITRLHGVGRKTINGFYASYDDTHPTTTHLPHMDFHMSMIAINQVTQDAFPSSASILCGYLLMLLTCWCSYSWWATHYTHELETNLQRILQRINCKDVFLQQAIRWEFKHVGRETWIEIMQTTSQPVTR